MNIDFHYYCIAILSMAAGFDREDAFTIAYASQYLDDATDGTPLIIGKEGNEFYPVRTQHIGVKAFLESYWREIYMPFHFPPPHPYGNGNFSFIVESAHAQSLLSHRILDEALNEPPDETITHSDEMIRMRLKWRRYLCRTGIAIHTFSDSWAHQGFSGRFNWENNVIAIYELAYDKDEEEYNRRSIFWRVLPPVGHARTGLYADNTDFIGKYIIRKNGTGTEEIKRNNQIEFLQAAEAVYNKLLYAKKPDYMEKVNIIPWENLRDKINKLLTSHEVNMKKRCWNWLREFKDIITGNMWRHFRYDIKKWKREALKIAGKRKIDDIYNFPDVNWENFQQSLWFHFHEAARQQRNFVMNRLPPPYGTKEGFPETERNFSEHSPSNTEKKFKIMTDN